MSRNSVVRRTLAFGGTSALILSVTMAGGGAAFASGRGAAPCMVPSASYPTIQSAVDATTCTTVRVAPGTYTENLTIARSLTLNGAKAGQDARTRRGTGESVINGGALATVTITADNVTVDGFTLNGPQNSGTAALVMQNQNSGETVQNNIINNPGRAASITTNRSRFLRNVVKNTSTSTDGFQANSHPVRDITVAGNTFSGANPAIYNADVTIIEGNADVTVADNKSTGNGTLVALFKTNGAKVTGNTIVGTSNSSAVYVGGGNSNVEVSGNTISSARTAVNVANDFGKGTNSGVTVTKNTLRNNQYGVKVSAAAATGTVKVNGNSLTGNTLAGVFNDPASGGATNATCNWWGAITGPGAVGTGRGDKVSTGVTYRPWLRLPGLTILCR